MAVASTLLTVLIITKLLYTSYQIFDRFFASATDFSDSLKQISDFLRRHRKEISELKLQDRANEMQQTVNQSVILLNNINRNFAVLEKKVSIALEKSRIEGN